MTKTILLVCWDFPPNYGIGGRRWAKFTKSLLKHGYTIHVIKSDVPKKNVVSSWFKDVDHKAVKTYTLKSHWALEWLNDYTSPLSALKIRVARAYLLLFYKGTIFDKTVGLQHDFLNLAETVVTQNNIKTVIVTGAPFNLIYYTALLKNKLPFLKIIADYRDPWINSVNYGMTSLSTKRRQHEQVKQDLVFQKTDLITAPNQFLIGQIKQTYNGKPTGVKFLDLPHMYDPDDIFVPSKKAVKDANVLKLVYAGALYTDSDRFLDLLAKAMFHFNSLHSPARVELDIYTQHRTKIFDENRVGDHVKFLTPVGDKIFEFISNYDLMLILLSDHNKDFKTTKFFDFLPYKVPYLYVGPPGFVSESIVNDRLGYLLQKQNDLEQIYAAIRQSPVTSGFMDISEHSLDKVTEKLINNFI